MSSSYSSRPQTATREPVDDPHRDPVFLGSAMHNEAIASSQPTIYLRRFHLDPWYFLASAILPTMLKRRTNGPRIARKRKKGNATYTLSSLDPTSEDDLPTEDVRVWNISASEKTGRVMASRKTLKHYRQVIPSSPEEPSTSTKPGGVEETADVEDTGVLADSEFSKPVKIKRPKKKRVRVFKENDSVSGLLIPSFPLAYSRF